METEIQKAYKLLQRESGIEVGDKVKVLRTWRENEMGYYGCLHPAIPEIVGGIGIVKRLRYGGTGDYWRSIDVSQFENGANAYVNVPFFCLELVEKAAKEDVDVKWSDGGVTVDGHFISKDTLKQNLNL